jgi:hydroxyethylthiazole kinase
MSKRIAPVRTSPFAVLERVRQQKPIVHHLTNWVTIYDCAQVVKTLGGSPVMAHAREEAADMTRIASALVLNIGTLTADFVESMKQAALGANARVIPVILDVCGAGATGFRDRKCLELLDQVRIDLVKGNASEIASLCGEKVTTRGVDAAEVGANLSLLAEKMARQRKTTVVVTGEVDIATNGSKTYQVRNGDILMTHLVGTGCMATSVIGAFAAVESDLAWAAASALACYGIAGELAAQGAPGPAAFKQALFDSLYRLDRETVEGRARIAE